METFISTATLCRQYGIRRGAGGHGLSDDQVRLSVTPYKKGNKKRMHITVKDKTLKIINMLNCNVDILFDPETKTFLLRKIKDGGWKMLKNQNSDTSHVQITLQPFMPFPVEAKSLVLPLTIKNGNIMF